MTSAKVGVVIPAYNAAPFISDCLRSAVAQDYDNLRVYVVDDASTDKTAAIISQLAAVFPDRIRWKLNPKNQGEASTRQEAIAAALADGCEYVAPLDADDLRAHDSITNQVSTLEREHDAGVCYGNSNIIHANGSLATNTGWEGYAAIVKRLPKGEVWNRLIAYGTLGRPSTILIRAAVARCCRYDSSIKYFVDLDYLAQVATLPQYSHFVPFDGIVGSYRFHANQAADRIGAGKLSMVRYTDMQVVALRIFHRLEQQGRAVAVNTRRRLWRMLVLRVILRAAQSHELSNITRLCHDFARPIERLEASYRNSKQSGRLPELLGVWAH